VVYTSASLALATLETLVHVDRDLLPADRVQVEIDVPDDLAVLSVEVGDLPKTWRSHPGPPRLQQIGDEWLEGVSAPVLRVPSAVIPTEVNYLLNPRHTDLARVTVASIAAFAYDARLLS
jgi:RES domain-containing protein